MPLELTNTEADNDILDHVQDHVYLHKMKWAWAWLKRGTATKALSLGVVTVTTHGRQSLFLLSFFHLLSLVSVYCMKKEFSVF